MASWIFGRFDDGNLGIEIFCSHPGARRRFVLRGTGSPGPYINLGLPRSEPVVVIA